jgi:competence protein ComEC
MPDRDDVGWDEGRAGSRPREGPLLAFLTSAARALEAESDRRFPWLPVLFAGGIVAYFALADEPGARIAASLLLGAIGLCLAARHAPLGLCVGGAAIAFAAGFTAAKLRTETVRAPVLAQELRYVNVAGFVEAHALRDKGRARLTLRVLSLGDLDAGERPYRVPVTLPARDGANATIGEAVSLRATLQPPPRADFARRLRFRRQAWFSSLGATGYATSKVTPLADAPRRHGTWRPGRGSMR